MGSDTLCFSPVKKLYFLLRVCNCSLAHYFLFLSQENDRDNATLSKTSAIIKRKLIQLKVWLIKCLSSCYILGCNQLIVRFKSATCPNLELKNPTFQSNPTSNMRAENWNFDHCQHVLIKMDTFFFSRRPFATVHFPTN